MDTEKILEIGDVIKFIESAIISNSNDIIVETKFGKLFIDTDCKQFDPNVNVIIEEWKITGPENNCFNINNINNNVDYYICICNYNSDLKLHLSCIEAIYRAIFKSIFKIDISDDVIDALLIIHSFEIDNKTLTTNILSDNFCKYNLGFFKRKDPMIRWLVEDHFKKRIYAAQLVIDKSEELFNDTSNYSNYIDIKYNNYYRKIFGIILYVSTKMNIDIRKNDIIKEMFIDK